MMRSFSLSLLLGAALLTGCDSGDSDGGAGSGPKSFNGTYAGTGTSREGVTYTVTVPITGNEADLRTTNTTIVGGGKTVTLSGRGNASGGTLGFTSLTSVTPACSGSVIGAVSDDFKILSGVQVVAECDNGTYVFLDPITLRRK